MALDEVWVDFFSVEVIEKYLDLFPDVNLRHTIMIGFVCVQSSWYTRALYIGCRRGSPSRAEACPCRWRPLPQTPKSRHTTGGRMPAVLPARFKTCGPLRRSVSFEAAPAI